jgi:hypothetical protein
MKERRKMRGWPAGLILAVALGLPAPAAPAAEQRLATAVRTGSPPRIDGRLDEAAWKTAPAADAFLQNEPLDGRPASEPTEVRILFDDENIYFGVRCFDSDPTRLVATEMRRDASLESDDLFEILIDTYHDSRNAFYFATNPLGAEFDAMIRDEGASNNKDWDGIWLCRTTRDAAGWTIEMAVPLRTLRFGSDPRPIWGINFGRRIARKKETAFWSPVSRDLGFMGKYRVSFFGHLGGLENLRQGEKLQIMPSLLAGGSRPDEGEPMAAKLEAGLDLKYRLTSNMTADLTVNTDFAQVEADQEKFNLTRFDLFYPEKREFFLEGADIFRFGERFQEMEPPSTLLFFSRTIGLDGNGREVPILGGVKMTGKAGRFDVGAMSILTDRLSYLEDGEPFSSARMSSSIVRIKKDIFEKSSIGIIGVSRDPLGGGGDYNRSFGADFSLAFGANFQAAGFLARTDTPGLKGDDGAGHVNLFWNSDFVSADASYTDIGENFNAEMGFVPRTDVRKLRWNIMLAPRPRWLGLRQTFLMNNFTRYENHAGVLESRSNMVGAFNLFQNGTELFFGYADSFERLDEPFEIEEGVFIPAGNHAYGMFVTMFNSDRTRPVSVETEVDAGGFYNGRLFSLRAQGSIKAARGLSLELIYSRNAFDLPVPGGRFAVNIGAARVVYAFSPDLFAKAYLQWNDSEELFRGNVLLRWIYKPGASLFLIYNEARLIGAAGAVKDRTIMLKASFLFNLVRS